MNSGLIYDMWKYILFVIILTIVIESMWFFIIIPDYEKLPTDFQLNIEHEGEDQIAYDVFGELSLPFRLQESLIQKVIAVDGDILTIESIVQGLRSDTGEIIFNSEKNYHVNRVTYMHSDLDQKYFGFLQGVEKQDYDFFHPLIFNDANLVFKEIMEIQGLEVYVFTAETISNEISFAFPQFAPNVVLSDTFSKLWVEPITGNIIRYEKNWEDYVLMGETQKNIIQKGWKHTTSFTESILVDYAIVKIENLRFYKVLMPLFLGTLFLGIGSIFILLKNYFLIQKTMEKKNKLEILGDFSSRLSHDLRNPLSIIQMANTLNIEKPSRDPVELERRNGMIENAITRMTNQIDEVLSFVRKSNIVFSDTSILKCIKNSLTGINMPENIKLTLPSNDFILPIDSPKIEIVFVNIVRNAIYSIGNAIGQIDIRLSESNSNIIISIINSGPTIPESDLDKIFEPLFTTKQIGTGLGLLICKTIVEDHNGSIHVENNPTNFKIILQKYQKTDKLNL